MNYQEFLERVIDDGIKEAKRDYKDKEHQPHLHGSVAGFEVCRNKIPLVLGSLLKEAGRSTYESRMQQEESSTYWFKRCYELEIEWVCNVVSAMLVNQGLPAIGMMTAGGVLKAAKILGVQE